MTDLNDIRRDYGEQELNKANAASNPIQQLQRWLDAAIQADLIDSTAMFIATVDPNGHPDSRIVLLKDIIDNELVFYTHAKSTKAKQLSEHPEVAVNFYWPALSRQVRIKGVAKLLPINKAKDYFKKRPRDSQLAAHLATQSATIDNRAVLETKHQQLAKQYDRKEVPCPSTWCGYVITPTEFEFFQGRNSRIHDRLRYEWHKQQWHIQRLAP